MSPCGPPIWIAGVVSGHRLKIGQQPSAWKFLSRVQQFLGRWEVMAKSGTRVLWVQAKGLSWKYHPGLATGSSHLVSALRGQLPTAAAGRYYVPLPLAGPCGPCLAQKESFLHALTYI